MLTFNCFGDTIILGYSIRIRPLVQSASKRMQGFVGCVSSVCASVPRGGNVAVKTDAKTNADPM